MIKKICVTFFGSGYLPIAPGTWGSLAASIAFVILVWAFDFHSEPELSTILTISVVLSYIIGVAFGPWAVEHFQKEDPKQFVLDEVAGMWVAVIAMPFSDARGLFLVVLVQFLLFRIFDILKPTPAHESEKLPCGWGIMTDDIIAGIYANIVGQVLFRLILPQIG